jgi:hypothetical protein
MTLLEVAAEKRMLEMVEGTAARNFDRSMQRPATRYGGPLKDTPLSFFGEPSANSPRNAYTTWKICSTWARAYQSESIPRRQIATREEMEQIEEA